jgi:hypothetical protein
MVGLLRLTGYRILPSMTEPEPHFYLPETADPRVRRDPYAVWLQEAGGGD